MSSISNVFNSLGPNSNQRSSSQKPYEETHYPYGIFVRNYNNNIIGFGSTHFHYSNNAQEKASIKQTIHLILDQLKPGAMVMIHESNRRAEPLIELIWSLVQEWLLIRLWILPWITKR